LEHQEPEDVAEHVTAGDGHEEADERHREGERDPAHGREVADGGDRQHDHVGGHDEAPHGKQRQASRASGGDGSRGRSGGHAAEDSRDQPRLEQHEDGRDEKELRAVPVDGDGRRERRQQEGLHDEEAPPARPVLPPHDQERRDEPEKGEEVRRGGDRLGRHRSRNIDVTERRASANDPARSSGTRNRRSLAMAVSITASSPASTVSLAARNIAKTARAMVGSASAATATSRLLPIPPKALPASRPARARKNAPTRNRYIKTMTLPAKPSAGRLITSGTINALTSIVAARTVGVTAKIQDVVVDTTRSLPRSLRRPA